MSKEESVFGYVLCITEKGKNSYVCDKMLYDLDSSIKIIEENIKRLVDRLNETDDSGCYMSFSKILREKNKLGLIADYEIKEMRSDTLYVRYSLFEIEL